MRKNLLPLTLICVMAGAGHLWAAGQNHNTHGMASAGFSSQYAIWAFLLGGFSALSLLIGSVVGVVGKPKTGVLAAMTAFGSGALLAALSVELVAPTAMALISHDTAGHGDPKSALFALLVGSVAGGILFVVLDQLVSQKGGYLRKSATAIAFFSHRRAARTREMLKRISRVNFFQAIPVEKLQSLVDYLQPMSFEEGEQLFKKGDEGDKMIFIEHGEVGIIDEGEEFKTLGPGDLVGEISLLTGAPRSADAVAHSHTVALVLSKLDFEKIRELTPEIVQAASDLANSRLDELRERHENRVFAESQWSKQAINALRLGKAVPTPTQVRQAAHEHDGAPLAIWLGILLDGIPESFVIGAGLFTVVNAKLAHGPPDFLEVVPFTLIAGLFLSNFPEAMSSSVGMKSQGWSTPKILLLWSSLVIVTALGSLIGCVVGAQVSHTFVIGIEGIAAGAMLTMIAQTMIPEAVHLGGPNVVGLSTLAGFLSAIAFKLLES